MTKMIEKKEYIAPQMICVELSIHDTQLLCCSDANVETMEGDEVGSIGIFGNDKA